MLLVLLAAVAAFLVAPYIVEEECKGSRGTTSLGAHDCQLSRSEVGCVTGLEGLGSNNVTQRERTANNSSGKGTLGSTTDVGNSQLYPSC